MLSVYINTSFRLHQRRMDGFRGLLDEVNNRGIVKKKDKYGIGAGAPRARHSWPPKNQHVNGRDIISAACLWLLAQLAFLCRAIIYRRRMHLFPAVSLRWKNLPVVNETRALERLG